MLRRRTRDRNAHRAALRGSHALAATLAVATLGCSPSLDADTAVIASVIDGDTVVVEIAGTTERVRLIGIDTPELARDGEPAECGAELATMALSALIPVGSTVAVSREVVGRDHYGRLLAHLAPDGSSDPVSLTMAESGYADALAIEPNTMLADRIDAAVRSARTARRGLWGMCPPAER